MRRVVASLILLVGLAACAENPIPPGYTGPTATIWDSFTRRSSTSIDVFFVHKIDNRTIADSLHARRQADYGMGFFMRPLTLSRAVPAVESTFTIEGRTDHAAPILGILNKEFQIVGTTKFAPLPDHTYTVRGVLGDDYSAVWIEDDNGVVVGQKVEVHGSTSLGILEK